MRLKGYERALEEAQVPYDPALVESGNWMADEAYRATIRLLDRAPDITAIYAQNDLMALGVMSALYGRGLSVPEDCAVVGCDDIPMAKHAIPPLTTVHVPFYETGRRPCGSCSTSSRAGRIGRNVCCCRSIWCAVVRAAQA